MHNTLRLVYVAQCVFYVEVTTVRASDAGTDDDIQIQFDDDPDYKNLDNKKNNFESGR